MGIELPKSKLPALTQNPKNLILYGIPKVGKTTLASTLPNNLILDLENGTDYVDALKIKINNLKDLFEVINEIIKAGKPYDFITIDTTTQLQELAKPLALKLFKDTPQGSNSTIDDVTKAPNGAGYGFLREAIDKILTKISSACENIILIGHVKDKSIVGSEGSEIGSVKDFDMVGKLPAILSAKSDAIGWIYRDDESNLCINFQNDGSCNAGARPKHLANKTIVVATSNNDGSFTPHWERIYPSLNDKK